MKCNNCGAELIFNNKNFTCKYCGSTFFKEELLPLTLQNKEFKIVGGVLLAYFGNQAQVVIPSGTIAIGKEAFKNNLAVIRVVFSKTVTQIESNAFEGCVNLTEIVDYYNVFKFGDECFKFAGLKQITIGRNVEYLGKGCFSRMPNLEVVYYAPNKILKLNHTFAYCQNLKVVEEEVHNFFPSFHFSLEVKNNPNNKRPTFSDAFVGTPYITKVKERYMSYYTQGICPECGGRINKGLFHAKCNNCGIDYKN